MDISMVKFDEKGLVPAIVQEENGQVLMLAYMNEESLQKTIETGYTCSSVAVGKSCGKREKPREMCSR